MQCSDGERGKMASCSDETLPSPVSVAPVSAEYERALVTTRLRSLEELVENMLERVIALELYRDRKSSKPPEFELSKGPDGIRVRGKQLVGVATVLAIAAVTIAYFIMKSR